MSNDLAFDFRRVDGNALGDKSRVILIIIGGSRRLWPNAVPPPRQYLRIRQGVVPLAELAHTSSESMLQQWSFAKGVLVFRAPVVGDTGRLMSKQEWFNRGAHAFGQAAPKYRGAGYACPLCLGVSPSLATFTFEDVPPRSVGGRPLVLTCEGCNSSSGHKYDWHWANFWALEGFATGDMRGPVDVQFTYEDLRSVAELSKENGTFTLKIIKEASNPESVKETERLFGDAVKRKNRPEPMNVTFHKSKFDERLLRLSVLRAAYLTGIAVAGYRWIPVWNPIRRQILDTTIRDANLSQLIRYEREHSRDRRALGIIDAPADMRSFCIGFGRWTVFLPWERESVLYQQEKLAGQRIDFNGSAYEWPTAPTFGIDWSPR